MQVLLSIKPQYAERILGGQKRWEFRRSIFRSADIDRVIMYASSPVKMVVGDFGIREIICLPIDDLWESTKEHAGISELAFHDYFRGKHAGYAIEVNEVRRYPTPLPLRDVYGAVPPQSFAYIR